MVFDPADSNEVSRQTFQKSLNAIFYSVLLWIRAQFLLLKNSIPLFLEVINKDIVLKECLLYPAHDTDHTWVIHLMTFKIRGYYCFIGTCTMLQTGITVLATKG